MSEAAFSGLRVIDLCDGRAGAYCTKWFADFGAEVIKIEPPAGAALRARGPFVGDRPHPETGASFLYLDTGKKSITLNLEQPLAVRIARRLIATADVLVEDRAPGSLDAIELSYPELEADNPRLVYLSISPFGQNGPYRDYPATDLTLAAFSGTMHDRMIAGRNPVRMGGAQGDAIAGRVAFIATMGALLHREATGRGQHIDLSMLEAIAGNDLAAPTTYSYNGMVHQPRRQPAARGRGGLGRYPCKDGWVDVMPGVGGLKKLAILLGDPSLAEHELFTDHALRAKHADAFDAEFMIPWLETRNRDEVVEQAQRLGMPFSYTLSTDELLRDPQLEARGFFVTVEQPVTGPVTQPGPPARLSGSRWEAKPAPVLGSANHDVLVGELGYTREQLTQLREQGIA